MDNTLISLLGLPEKGPLMVALVGAGGKTTTMMALALEYKALHKNVMVTTTTRIYMPPDEFWDYSFIGTRPASADAAVPDGSVTVVGEAVEGDGKLVGVGREWLDSIYQESVYDIILIEADGSKGKPLKAPASYEPVIPAACTHVIGIIGMDAFGQPMSDRWIHRLPEFLEVTGGEIDQEIDVNALIKLIGSPDGLFKNSPEKAARILLLNKCTESSRVNAADSLVSECIRQGVGKLAKGAWR